MRPGVLCAAIATLAACGGGAREQATGEQEAFNCHDRLASFMVAKDLSGEERGVQIDCADAGPRIKRWKTDKSGQHLEDARSLTPDEFDKIWTEIDGTGWPNLKDCANGTLGKSDPVYQFDIHDDQNRASFSCQTREVPYPYFDITNALELAANQGQKQLGGEPADLPGDDEPGKGKKR